MECLHSSGVVMSTAYYVLVYKTTLESRFFCILQNVILQVHLERQLKNLNGIFLYIKRTLIEFMIDNEFKNLNIKPGCTY